MNFVSPHSCLRYAVTHSSSMLHVYDGDVYLSLLSFNTKMAIFLVVAPCVVLGGHSLKLIALMISCDHTQALELSSHSDLSDQSHGNLPKPHNRPDHIMLTLRFLALLYSYKGFIGFYYLNSMWILA